MNLMRTYCACGLVIASFFLLTCYDPPSSLGPPDIDINVVLMSSLGSSTIPSATNTADSRKTFDVGRQIQLKFIMTGTSYFDSIAVRIASNVDSTGETMRDRSLWTDTVWSQLYDINDTATKTVSVTAFAKGMNPIENQCWVKVRVLFINPVIETVFDQDSACSIGLKAMGSADDSLNFSIPNLHIWRKTFDVASLNLAQNSKDSATLHFAPIGHPGEYSIPVVVTDSRKTWNDTLYFEAHVQYVDVSPTIDTVIGRTTVTAGEPISLEVLFSNRDGDADLSMIIKDKPDGAVFSTATDGKATFLLKTDTTSPEIDTVVFIAKDNGMQTDTLMVYLQITPVKKEVLPPPSPVPIVAVAGKGGSIDLVSLLASGQTNGRISLVDTLDISFSDSAIFTITPDIGFHITDVIVDGLSKGQITKYRFTDVRTPHEIRAEFALDQHSFSITSDGHGTVTPAITTKIDHGIVLEITAVADKGYHFIKWQTTTAEKALLADSLSARTTVTVMGDSARVVAAFEADFVYITEGPAGQTVFEGDAVTFSVAAVGLDVKYQWYKENSAITDAVSAKYSSIAALADSGTNFHCIASNFKSCDTSAAAILIVKKHSVQPTGITTSSGQLCEGDSTMLTVVGGVLYSGASWKWYSAACGGSYAGQGISITVKPLATTTFFVRAEGAGDTSGCAAITISVNTTSVAPNGISANPAAICSGTSSILSITGGVLGTGAQWNWYAGSCGNNFQLAGTGTQITVWPQQTTRYHVRSEGQCSTSPCSTITVIVYKPFYDVWPGKKLKRNADTITYGDNISLSIISAPPAGSWNWFSDACNGSLLGKGNSISHVPLTMGNIRYYVRDENIGRCDTIFFDTVVVDTVNPLALYSFKNSNANNESKYVTNKYNMAYNGLAFSPTTPRFVTLSGTSYLQSSLPFYPKDEFTISAWVNIDTVSRHDTTKNVVFWIDSTGVMVDDSTLSFYYKGVLLQPNSFILRKHVFKNGFYLAYKVSKNASSLFVQGLIDTFTTNATIADSTHFISICESTLPIAKAIPDGQNLFFGGHGANPTLTTGGLVGSLDNIRIYAYPINKTKMFNDILSGRTDP